MAYSPQEIAALASAFQQLPENARALLSSKSTDDTKEAIAALIVQMRGSSMSEQISSIVTVQVSDRSELRALAAVADGATMVESVKAFRAALNSDDAPLSGAFSVALAALKHYGL